MVLILKSLLLVYLVKLDRFDYFEIIVRFGKQKQALQLFMLI